MDGTYFIDILNSSKHAIVSFNLDCSVTFINNQAEQILNSEKSNIPSLLGITQELLERYNEELQLKQKNMQNQL